MDNSQLIATVSNALNTIDKALETVSVISMKTLGMKSTGWMVVDYSEGVSHAVTVTEVPWTE